jgi:signal peptidase I
MKTITLLLSFVLTGWVAVDASRRNLSLYGWSRLVAFTGIFGFIAWLVVRRRAPVVVERLGVMRSSLLALAGLPLVAFAVLTSMFVVTFLFQFARVEGQAMAPTLRDQERVIINKWAYRTAGPQRGDIVMHYYPLNPDRSFVKRVIAEAGDTVRIVDGRVFVNDVPMQDDFVPPEFRSHDDFGPTVIAEGYYFVMGDHRNNSSDSRHWGFVPKKYIVGRVVQLRLSEVRGPGQTP